MVFVARLAKSGTFTIVIRVYPADFQQRSCPKRDLEFYRIASIPLTPYSTNDSRYLAYRLLPVLRKGAIVWKGKSEASKKPCDISSSLYLYHTSSLYLAAIQMLLIFITNHNFFNPPYTLRLNNSELTSHRHILTVPNLWKPF